MRQIDKEIIKAAKDLKKSLKEFRKTFDNLEFNYMLKRRNEEIK